MQDKKGKQKNQWGLTRQALQAARRTWNPQRLQDEARSLQKSMLDPQKVDVRKQQFLASIFSPVGLRFGMVFERFFESKTHATSKDAFSAKASKLLIFFREN